MSLEIVVDGISWETSSLYKVKATLAHWPSAKVLLLSPVGEPKFVNVSLLKKNIVTFVMTMSSTFFTFYTDESMCAMRSALLVPIQMWKSTFMSWSFMFRFDICISSDDSFIASAETKGGVAEMFMRRKLCHLGFTTANFPLFRFPKNFSKDFLACVFRSRKCGFLALCF